MSDFLNKIERSRTFARDAIADERKKLSEQYFTPPAVAELMASFFSASESPLRVLDPCCGVGNLAATFHQSRTVGDVPVNYVLLERDRFLWAQASDNFFAEENFEVVLGDFFLTYDCLGEFDRIIMNPPYSKIKAGSIVSQICKERLGYSETNLYSAFLACCVSILAPEGELVAIVPRSFCSGPYFKGFREYILSETSISSICSFESRKVFWDSKVTQEILIIKLSRKVSSFVEVKHVSIDGGVSSFNTRPDRIVFPSDLNKIIHVPSLINDEQLLAKFTSFTCTIASSGLRASTGKVVDFRVSDELFFTRGESMVRVIYQDAVCTALGVDVACLDVSKPRYLRVCDSTKSLVLKDDNYVLVRRISFKESPCRIIASPLLMGDYQGEGGIAVDNHVNYIWGVGVSISAELCVALSAYLSTPTVDRYVRRFSGHTQINSSDLNSLPIPELCELESFYDSFGGVDLSALILQAEDYFFG